MKKAIIVLLLLACLCAPCCVWANIIKMGSLGLSVSMGLDGDGPSFNGFGIYYEACPEIKNLEYVYPVIKFGFNITAMDLRQSYLYVDLTASYEYYAGLGAGAEFHLVNDDLVANMYAVICGGSPEVGGGGIFSAECFLTVRYVFLNNTGVSPLKFSLDMGINTWDGYQ